MWNPFEALIGPAEPRLLQVERGLENMDRDIRNIRRAAVALGQGIWQEWGAIGSLTETETATTIVGGAVSGCGHTIAGLTVMVKNHATGALLGSGSTDGSGNFSVSFGLTGSVNVDVTLSGVGWVSSTTNTTITAGYTTTLGPITVSPAAGYYTSDFAAVCTCLPWTLTITDSVYGNVTVTYDPANGWWRGCTVQAYPGTVNCGAGNIAVQYTLAGSVFALNWNLTVAWQIHIVAGHSCPLTATTCATSTFASTRTVSVAAAFSCTGVNTWNFGANANSPWPGAATLTCRP